MTRSIAAKYRARVLDAVVNNDRFAISEMAKECRDVLEITRYADNLILASQAKNRQLEDQLARTLTEMLGAVA